MLACIKEDYEACDVYLEFIFDYNMEFTDTFEKEVEMVDVYVFDADGYYLFNRHAECATDLIGRKRMVLDNGFTVGTYHLLTVGGLTGNFRFSDLNDGPFQPGVTSYKEAKLSLYHETNDVSEEFPHLWFGETTVINYNADLAVWQTRMIRETNRFHVTLKCTNTDHQQKKNTLYTFDIITPESGAYGYDNQPRIKEQVTYHPYYLVSGTQPDLLAEAHLATMRLFANEREDYRLVVRRTDNQQEVWSYNLISLLEKAAYRPDGTILPLQEYLDRECDWNIIIYCKEDPEGPDPEDPDPEDPDPEDPDPEDPDPEDPDPEDPDPEDPDPEDPDPDSGAFIAVAIEINGWIIWLNDIDL
ncbi:MAG: FimB/Mfa2 family fimbrial subunit [Tannerellaceae bacterium]|nr:FimB/Mfa2 family fimbrial subunit [Tannerellaceae bacterium]